MLPIMNTLTAQTTCRIMIVDDNTFFRTCVGFLTRHIQCAELVGEFESGSVALCSIPVLMPDIILVDLFMPDMDGITLTRLIRENYPNMQIIAITGSMNNRIVNRAIKAGASQVVFKEKFVAGLLNAIPQLQGNL
jgi:two-component system NarL family response regulator